MFFVNKSFKKSRIMSKIERLELADVFKKPSINVVRMMEDGEKYRNKRKKLYHQLFECMMNMDGYRESLIKYNLTEIELARMAEVIQTKIMHFVPYMNLKQGTDYLPVALVSLGRPLDYLLLHKEEILAWKSKNIDDYIRTAIELL